MQQDSNITDLWVHASCALWSAEVYEGSDGRLLNVAAASRRGKKLVHLTLYPHVLTASSEVHPV